MFSRLLFNGAVRRQFSQSAVRNGGHGPPTGADMLPFNPDQNKWMLLVKMSVVVGIAFNIPFFAVWYNLKKKYGGDK